MVIVIRTLFATLILGLATLALAPFVVSAQSTTAQLIVVTKTASGVIPSSAGTVIVTGTGPSLSSTPTSSATLSYSSSFAPDTRVVTMVPGSYSVASTLSGSSISYSPNCTGYLSAGEVRTCTVTSAGTGTGGSARVNVTVQVINDNGGTRSANDFVITVAGLNTSVSTFQGSNGSVQVTLSGGSYSIDAASVGSYYISRSADCSGTIGDGETRSCSITLNDMGTTGVSGTTRLTCTPSRQGALLGSTVSFAAQGGNGVYTWTTADRTFVGVGSRLNVILGTLGTQSVYVTSGYETAGCIVDVTGTGVTGVVGTTGSVLGTSTQIPGLPNTGFAPLSLNLLFALIGAFIALPVALIFAYPYVRSVFKTRLG